MVHRFFIETYTQKMKNKIRSIVLIFMIVSPIILWFLPADFFDSGEYITCPSVAFFNTECFGCGMTRAVMHFHHFQYPEAFFFNYGVIVVYPLLFLLWVQAFIELRRMWNASQQK